MLKRKHILILKYMLEFGDRINWLQYQLIILTGKLFNRYFQISFYLQSAVLIKMLLKQKYIVEWKDGDA